MCLQTPHPNLLRPALSQFSFFFLAGLGLDVLCHHLGLFKRNSPAQRKLSASAGFFLAAVQLHLRGKVHPLTLQMVEQTNGWVDECSAQALACSPSLRLVRYMAASPVDGCFPLVSCNPHCSVGNLAHVHICCSSGVIQGALLVESFTVV